MPPRVSEREQTADTILGRPNTRERTGEVPMEKITLQAVAERAGVSLATASKVMNQRADVSEATRHAVAEAAQHLGYSPRRARSLRKGPRSISIVFDTISSPYALAILAGAQNAAARAGADLIIDSTDQSYATHAPPLSRIWFRERAEMSCRGVIAVTTPITENSCTWADEAGLPLIVIDPKLPASSAISRSGALVRISSTNWAGGRAAVEHLIELGHRRIGLVTGSLDSAPARERMEGYRSALEAAGIAFDQELVDGDSYTFEEGHRVAEQMLRIPDRPTAIFASADTLALGVLRAASEHSFSVPDDLSLITFDDTPLATWTDPQLTAVHQPLFSMGQVAVERALVLAEDPDRFARPFQLETELVLRESTGPAAKR